MHTIEQQIIDIVQQAFGLEPGRVDLTSPLAEFGDSLDWVGLLGSLESHFDLRIDDEQGSSLVRVGDIVRLVAMQRPAALEVGLV